MGIANIGIPGLILIVIGPNKLPEIGKAAGETLKAFKLSVNERDSDEKKKNN